MKSATTLNKLEPQFHPTFNEFLLFSDVKQSMVVWWLGECGHSWKAKVANRLNGSGCPFCSGQKVLPGFNDLLFRFPDIASQWHPTLNGELNPACVSAGSEKHVWWLGSCGHEWEAVIHARVGKKSGCPYCSNQKVLAGFNDLATVNPRLAEDFHVDKNFPLTPDEVLEFSNRKVWWLGKGCGHEWEATVNHRRNGTGCPYCSNQKVLAGFNDLATVNPRLAGEWHPTRNGLVTPENVGVGSSKKAWWVGSCGHEWEASINGRTVNGCPVCSGQKVLPGFNDLLFRFPDIASQWHPTLNGELQADQVTSSSRKKVWWVCENKHEWVASVANRAGKSSGCPYCFGAGSKLEESLAEWLMLLVPGDVSVVRKTRSVIAPLELDFYIPERNIAIEFNGVYWHSEAAGKEKNYHRDKWLACREQGIQLIQVWEDDWVRNPGLVKRMLAHKLGLSDAGKFYARQLDVVGVSMGEAKLFLQDNHLQGFRVGKYFGLKTSDDVLVAVLGVARKGEDGLEIIRFATVGSVLGGFSKLVKHVLSVGGYGNVSAVYSYSHNDYSDGGVYEKNGFERVHDGSPGYSYLLPGNKVRVDRLQFSRKAFAQKPEFEFVEGLTERELATLNGLTRVWDSGSSLWVKHV